MLLPEIGFLRDNFGESDTRHKHQRSANVAGKYTPLEHYLKAIPAQQWEITLSFEQLEQMLNDKLPPSAYRHQAWWANENDGVHVNAHAWMNAGWLVDTVDQRRCIVRFRRG